SRGPRAAADGAAGKGGGVDRVRQLPVYGTCGAIRMYLSRHIATPSASPGGPRSFKCGRSIDPSEIRKFACPPRGPPHEHEIHHAKFRARPAGAPASRAHHLAAVLLLLVHGPDRQALRLARTARCL